MSDSDELDRILGEHKARTEKEAAEWKAKDKKETEWRTACADRLRETVVPPMKELAARLEVEGHKTKVNERLGSYIHPSVELSFAPKPRPQSEGGPGHSSPSTLRFVCEDAEIWAKGEIVKPDRGKIPYLPPGRIGPEQIQREWVEEKLLQFVKAALKAN